LSESLTNAENNFIDRLGLIAEAGGLTRISGRIWGLLVIAGKALAPVEIAESLQISRASVSMSLRMLAMLEVVEPKTKAGTRHTYYAMRDHPYLSMIQAQAKRANADADVVQSALAAIRRPDARKRLRELAAFYKIMEGGYLSMLERLEGLKSQ
jgi:DNA-binding transcriptional regulator GbsR (MarR family)